MTDNLTGPELFANASGHLDDIVDGEAQYESASGVQVDNRLLYATIANARATQALAAAVLMLVENHHDFAPYEVEAWRAVIPLPDLKECKGENTRRPACAKWHTEDCRYSDPVILAGTRVIHRARPAGGARAGTVREQERDASGDYHLRVEWDSGELDWITQTDVVVIRHERLPVGTRVLVFGSMTKREGGRIDFEGEPWAGKILGHSPNGTYKIAREFGRDHYGEKYPEYVFMDERVSVHPEGPECPPKDTP